MDLTPFWGRGNGNGNGTVWDPFRSFSDAFFDFPDRLGFDQPLFGLDWRNSGPRGKVDWVETSDAHVFKADVPGLKKENIKVEVLDGRVLNIEGERSKEKFQETDSWRCMERSHGKFSRRFGLPNNAKPEDVAARVEDGVLTVTVPKTKTEPSRVHSVPIA